MFYKWMNAEGINEKKLDGIYRRSFKQNFKECLVWSKKICFPWGNEKVNKIYIEWCVVLFS